MISGNPVFRFTLTHDVEGVFIVDEPKGWPDTKLVLERDQQFHSLIERFDGAFTFWGDNGRRNGGVNVVRYIENIYGPDADLQVDIDLSFDNSATFESVFTGLYDFSENEEINRNQIRSAIIRSDFWTKFINRMDTPVDIQSATGLDGDAVDVIPAINMTLTSQIIDKTTTYTGSIITDAFIPPEFVMPSGEIDGFTSITDSIEEEIFTTYNQEVTNLEQDEITQSFSPIFDFVSDPVDITPPIELIDESGDVTVNIESASAYLVLSGSLIMTSVETDPSVILEIDIDGRLHYQINDDAPVAFGTAFLDDQPGPTNPVSTVIPTIFSLPFSISIPDASFSVTLQQTDRLTIYVKWTITFIVDIGDSSGKGSIEYGGRKLEMYNFVSNTTFGMKSLFDDTVSECFLIHDVARSVIDRITSNNNSLSSAYLSNQLTSPSSITAGCGSGYVNLKGLHLRNYRLTEKPFAISLKDWWNGMNPILNLGLGYINDQDKIEIERQDEFYNPEISVYFDNVLDIVRRYDNDVIFNKIDIGYNKWQSDNTSGIDDPQTKHSYATRFKKIGKSISIMSGFVAASFAIETTRRTTRKKSADYKFDDDVFIIATDKDIEDPEDLLPELDEKFLSITNLSNPESRYNSRITPARNFLRWIKFFNGALQKYVGSVYKFVSGEGNYDMTSRLFLPDCEYDLQEPAGGTVSEKGDLEVEANYLHLSELYEINMPMTWTQYKSIRQNRKNAIGISQTSTGHVAFLIKSLEYQVCLSKAKVMAWSHMPFSIQNVDFVMPAPYCAGVDTGCGTSGRETEEGGERHTEGGLCREIE